MNIKTMFMNIGVKPVNIKTMFMNIGMKPLNIKTMFMNIGTKTMNIEAKSIRFAPMLANIAPVSTPNTLVRMHIAASFPGVATATAGLAVKV